MVVHGDVLCSSRSYALELVLSSHRPSGHTPPFCFWGVDGFVLCAVVGFKEFCRALVGFQDNAFDWCFAHSPAAPGAPEKAPKKWCRQVGIILLLIRIFSPSIVRTAYDLI